MIPAVFERLGIGCDVAIRDGEKSQLVDFAEQFREEVSAVVGAVASPNAALKAAKQLPPRLRNEVRGLLRARGLVLDVEIAVGVEPHVKLVRTPVPEVHVTRVRLLPAVQDQQTVRSSRVAVNAEPTVGVR